jgi:2'-5' RNA ligase
MHYEDPVFELALDGPGGMTDSEIALFLNGLTNVETLLVAAAEVHTGAMIALVPSDDDIGRLALDGYEEPTELHLTIAYLGDAADIPDEMKVLIMTNIEYLAEVFTPIIANAFSVNLFNPGTEDACVVLGVSGSDMLIDLHASVQSVLRGLSGTFPENHKPWIPHITLAYNQDGEVVTEAIERTGPVELDRIRIAFAGEIIDFPLGGSMLTAAAGTGPKDIRWGTDGSFDRCMRIMRGKVKDPGGLCATWHKKATGEWPAEEGVPSSADITTAAFIESEHARDAEGKFTDGPGVPNGSRLVDEFGEEYIRNTETNQWYERDPDDADAWVEITNPGIIESLEEDDTMRPAGSDDSDDELGDTPTLSTAEEQAVDYYAGDDGFISINSALRGTSEPSDDDEEAITHLDSAISKSRTTEPQTVFRAATRAWGGNIPVGSRFTDFGFTSTSMTKDTAEDFSEGGTIFSIEIPKGSRALNIESRKEDELLLPRGSSFEVISKESDGTVKLRLVTK